MSAKRSLYGKAKVYRFEISPRASDEAIARLAVNSIATAIAAIGQTRRMSKQKSGLALAISAPDLKAG